MLASMNNHYDIDLMLIEHGYELVDLEDMDM